MSMTPDERFDISPSVSNHFSWLRTRLSIERTMMAWVRTATALIGFGFTIVQFFDRFDSMDQVAAATRPELPRYLGMALTGCGVLAIIVSAFQYVWVSRYLAGPAFDQIARLSENRIRTPVLAIAILVALIGMVAFGAISLRYM